MNFPKCNETIAKISALASKMGQKAWYIIIDLHDNVPLSFLFDPS